MNKINDNQTHVDKRLTAYKIFIKLFLVTLTAFAVKLFLFDTILIKTSQMEPAILAGDRIVFTTTGFNFPLKWLSRLSINDIVISKTQKGNKFLACLRIAGTPGDTLEIIDGIFKNSHKKNCLPFSWRSDTTVVPASFSPRDAMNKFVIPNKEDTINLENLTMRDLLFAFTMMKQDNPSANYNLKSELYINDSLRNDYFIKEFYMYKGKFNKIPKNLYENWFFWDRLKEYFHAVLPNIDVKLKLSILKDGSICKNYEVEDDFYFLIADDWCNGYDSRYLGPISKSSMKGKAFCVLWSFGITENKRNKFRPERICKIIK